MGSPRLVPLVPSPRGSRDAEAILAQAVSEDDDRNVSETLSLARNSRELAVTRRKRPTIFQTVSLVSVPLFWGTFTPSMKLLLDHHHAPPVILTNLLSHMAGTIALGMLWIGEAIPRKRCLPEDDSGVAVDNAPSRRRMLTASCELGVYLFFGQLTQLLGLGGTSATTNAILVQSSVVLVPIIEEAQSGLPHAGRLVRLLPSVLALLGIAIITIVPSLLASETPTPSKARQGATEDTQTTFGIACSLISAIFYALHTLRLSEYGDVDATVQATGQVAANALLDVLALPLSANLGGNSANAVRWLRHTYNNDRSALHKLAVAATWNGVFIVGATTWAMSYAQRSFCASTAALTYAMEPLFAAIFAAAILDESLGLIQIAGGALIVGANVLVGMRAD